MSHALPHSELLFQQAQTLIPGGVNSPVRAFKGVGGTPLFIKKGQGPYLYDVDGHRYIDYIGSWGPLILGHAHPQVVEAIHQQLPLGLSYGAPTELEILLAKKVCDLMPSIQKIRMVNSGTEATMTAIRLARGFTQRNKIIKFNGCYHGHHDGLLVKAGSGLLTLSLPSTPGIPASMTEDTLIAEYNNIEQVQELFKQHGHDIAGIILEPIAGNMGFVLPQDNFLQQLRQLCDQHQSLLIFDEVMTGFRVALGGAQEVYQIQPDLTTLGKIIGGGMPVGALGGRADVMSYLAPEGPVYQAGTLSGNPIAMTAGLATLTLIAEPGFYTRLASSTQQLVEGMREVAARHAVAFQAKHIGGMFGFFFNDLPLIRNLHDVAQSNEVLFKQFYHGMMDRGVYLAPSMYEAGFVSIMHGPQDIEHTLNAMDQVLHQIVGVPRA